MSASPTPWSAREAKAAKFMDTYEPVLRAAFGMWPSEYDYLESSVPQRCQDLEKRLATNAAEYRSHLDPRSMRATCMLLGIENSVGGIERYLGSRATPKGVQRYVESLRIIPTNEGAGRATFKLDRTLDAYFAELKRKENMQTV